MASGKDGKDNNNGNEYVLLRKDRRRSLRRQLLVTKVIGEFGKNVFFGYAKIIGPNGMFIASVSPRYLGDEFEITCEVKEANVTIKSLCRVVWRREFDPARKTEPGMGLEFVNLDDETRQKIKEWVDKG
jgi:Tfp pilus assembly protein PilZ